MKTVKVQQEDATTWRNMQILILTMPNVLLLFCTFSIFLSDYEPTITIGYQNSSSCSAESDKADFEICQEQSFSAANAGHLISSYATGPTAQIAAKYSNR